MAEKKTLPIRDNSICPSAGTVTASPEQIKTWIMSTAPSAVEKAGQAHTSAAGLVKDQAGQLRGIAQRLAQHWRSESSAKTQQALQMLAATSEELATKLEMMGGALKDYGSVYLPAAQKKIQALPAEGGGGGNDDEGAGGGTTGVPSSEMVGHTSDGVVGADAGPNNEKAARAILQQLNEQIIQVYYQVPSEVTYSLPSVALPKDLGDPRPYHLPTTGTFQNPLDGTSNGSYTGNSGYGTGGPGSDPGGGRSDGYPGTDPGKGGTDPSGSRPDGPGHGSDGSDGSGSDGTGPDGSQRPGGDQPDSPGTGDDGTRDDGTTPPVIGGDRSTDTPGAPDNTDPRGTETSSVPPTITTTSTPNTWTPTTANPLVNPTGPGVPSVLGNPGGFGGGAAGAAPVAARAGMAGNGMFPFMPMGGGADGGGEYEHTTSLHEDPEAWATSHDVTNPLIG